MDGDPIPMPEGFSLEPDEKMPSQRHVSYALSRAQGKSRRVAAIDAGYADSGKKHRLDRIGWNMERKHPVVVRLEKYFRLGIEQRALKDADWVHQELGDMATVNALDFLTFDAHGRASVRLDQVVRWQGKGIEHLSFKDTFNSQGDKIGQVINLKLASPASIMKLLGSHVDVAAYTDAKEKEQAADLADRIARATERMVDYHTGDSHAVEGREAGGTDPAGEGAEGGEDGCDAGPGGEASGEGRDTSREEAWQTQARQDQEAAAQAEALKHLKDES